jgi:hypothetical protein
VTQGSRAPGQTDQWSTPAAIPRQVTLTSEPIYHHANGLKYIILKYFFILKTLFDNFQPLFHEF